MSLSRDDECFMSGLHNFAILFSFEVIDYDNPLCWKPTDIVAKFQIYTSLHSWIEIAQCYLELVESGVKAGGGVEFATRPRTLLIKVIVEH